MDLRRIGIDPDRWYPLLRDRRLKRGAVVAACFAGEPIVLVRPEQGEVFALEDRCAHRQFPLHKGVVTGDRIQCGYHGWCYDRTGRLTRVPYLPKGARPPRSVRRYPSREAYGHIFVFPGDPEKADRTPLPELPFWSSPRYRTLYYERRVRCHYSFMHENLMDMNHQFLHRRLTGWLRPVLLDSSSGDDWVEARYRFEREGGRRHRGVALLAGSSGDGAGEDEMVIRTEYPYQRLSLHRGGEEEPVFQMWAAYVPVDRRQWENQSVGMLMIRQPRWGGLLRLALPVIRRFTESVFAEDRMAVEAEQQAYERQGADWNQEVFPVILDLRRLLMRCGAPVQTGPDGRPAASAAPSCSGPGGEGAIGAGPPER